MGHCLRKMLTSPENEEDDRTTTTTALVPVEEVSRNAASASALVITHSFSAIAVGENKNNSTYDGEDDDFCYQMKTGFQNNCKQFIWPCPELWHKFALHSD